MPEIKRKTILAWKIVVINMLCICYHFVNWKDDFLRKIESRNFFQVRLLNRILLIAQKRNRQHKQGKTFAQT